MDYPYDLGPYARKVTTSSAEAQAWFDRGLNWCYGYHHEEALACFQRALEGFEALTSQVTACPTLSQHGGRLLLL